MSARQRWTAALRRRLPGNGLATNTVWAGGGDLVTLTSSLVVFYLLTTRLGVAGYGYFIGAQVLVATLATLSSSSSAMLLLQELVREQRPRDEVWRGCLGLTLLAGVATCLLSLPIAAVLLPGLSLLVVGLFAVAQLLGAGLVVLAGALEQSQGHFPRGVVLNGTLNLLRAVAVLCLAVVLGDDLTLLALAITYAGVHLLCAVGAVATVVRRYGLPLRPRRPDLFEARRGLSYAGTLISFGVQEDADKLLLVRLADPATNGLYATAYRFVQMATLPVRALVAASHPRFLEHDDTQVGQHVRRSLRATSLATAYAVLAALGLLVAAPLAAELLGQEYEDSVQLVYLLAPLVVLRALGLFAFNGLMGLGRNGVRLVVVTGCGILNVVLNVTLILAYGAVGAAVATLVSEVVFLACTWGALLYYQRRHDERVRMPATALTG